MPRWLWGGIIGVTIATGVIATGQWAACRFYVLPTIWPWYAKYSGTEVSEKIDLGPMGCNDVDSRTIAVMLGLLTTLISLSRKAD